MAAPRCLTCGTPDTDPDRPEWYTTPPMRCPHCPPIECDQCGGMDHVDDNCSCWVDVGEIPPADLKAMLARDGLGVGADGTWHTTTGAACFTEGRGE